MLITVPLMIWSARTEMDSQAWSADTSIPASIAAMTPMTSAGVAPKIELGVASGIAWLDEHRDHEPDERRRQHHALDADVDDAAPFAHHAAQRAERDRRRQLSVCGARTGEDR